MHQEILILLCCWPTNNILLIYNKNFTENDKTFIIWKAWVKIHILNYCLPKQFLRARTQKYNAKLVLKENPPKWEYVFSVFHSWSKAAQDKFIYRINVLFWQTSMVMKKTVICFPFILVKQIKYQVKWPIHKLKVSYLFQLKWYWRGPQAEWKQCLIGQWAIRNLKPFKLCSLFKYISILSFCSNYIQDELFSNFRHWHSFDIITK